MVKLVKLLGRWALQMFWQWHRTLSAEAPEASRAVGGPQQITHYACAGSAKYSRELANYSLVFVQEEPRCEVPIRSAT